MGDLVDRGPDSVTCCNMAKRLCRAGMHHSAYHTCMLVAFGHGVLQWDDGIHDLELQAHLIDSGAWPVPLSAYEKYCIAHHWLILVLPFICSARK